MRQKKLLQFSHLSDEDYLKHLLTKQEPTDEDNESAVRIENMLNTYRSLLEQVHSLASQDLADARAQLTRIRRLTAPISEARVARLQ